MNQLRLEGREKLRYQMIRDALQEKSPSLYRSLKKQGRLDQFVKDRERELWRAYQEGSQVELYDQALEKNYRENPIEQAAAIEARFRKLWEELLATYLEFSTEETTM